MKRILAVILTLILALGCCRAGAEDAGDKYGELTVGVTTAFSGNFLSDAMGSNISDQDVRKLIHSYRLVEWDSETGSYQMNSQVVTSVLKNGENNTYCPEPDLFRRDSDYGEGLCLQLSAADVPGTAGSIRTAE